jgi:hypothetical protein
VFLLISPFASFTLGTELTCYISIFAIQNLEGFTKLNYMFVIMQILVTLFMSLTGVAIFMYKKRSLQVRLCAFALLTNIFVIVALFLTTTLFTNVLQLPKENPINYLFPTYIPIVTLLLIGAATRSIRKDEALARSLNRLRK